MRVVFAGSAEFSTTILTALAVSGHDLVQVLTAPDRAGSRGAAAPRPVKAAAVALGLSVEQPPQLTQELWRDLASRSRPDVLVAAAYGQLLPRSLLDSLPEGGLGVHPSLLPRHRGASPVVGAILAGDSRTGVTVFRMDERMDAGPILAQQAIPVPAIATTQSLTSRLAQLGGQMVVQVLDALDDGDRIEIPQLDSGATYTHRLGRQDGSLDWSLSSETIDRSVRALSPWPGVTVPLLGTRVKLLRGAPEHGGGEGPQGEAGEIVKQGAEWILVRTGGGAFRLELIQPPGGPPMTPTAFLRGRRWSGRGNPGG